MCISALAPPAEAYSYSPSASLSLRIVLSETFDFYLFCLMILYIQYNKQHVFVMFSLLKCCHKILT